MPAGIWLITGLTLNWKNRIELGIAESAIYGMHSIAEKFVGV